MSSTRSRISAVAVIAVLLLGGCGGTTTDSIDQAGFQATTSEASPEPTSTDSSSEPLVTDEESPTDTTETSSGEAEWIASADGACQQAIDEYKTAKQAVGSDDPVTLQVAAAAATARAASIIDALPTPPSALAESLATGAREYAASQKGLADAMRNGLFEEEETAFDAVEAAGQRLADAGGSAGANACVAMTSDV